MQRALPHPTLRVATVSYGWHLHYQASLCSNLRSLQGHSSSTTRSKIEYAYAAVVVGSHQAAETG